MRRPPPPHTSPYGLTPNPGPGLILVKDDGIYLMSNGEPHLPGTDTVNKVVYAHGYEALPITASMEERMARYDKVRDAAGGDDFAEFLPSKSLVKLAPEGRLEIQLTLDKMSIIIVGPPAKPHAHVVSGTTQTFFCGASFSGAPLLIVSSGAGIGRNGFHIVPGRPTVAPSRDYQP